MVSEKELLRAIEECNNEPLTEKKVERLAVYYIIYDHLFGKPSDLGYSRKTNPDTESKEPKESKETDQYIKIDGKTEFLNLVNGKQKDRVWAVMDELMTDTLKIINPRLYDGVINKISQL